MALRNRLVWSSRTRALMKRLIRSGEMRISESGAQYESPGSYLEGCVAGLLLTYMFMSVAWLGDDLLPRSIDDLAVWQRLARAGSYGLLVLVGMVLSLNAVGPVMGWLFKRTSDE